MTVEIDGANNIIKTNSINEVTSANGITIDGLNIKDSKLVTANSVVEANITNGAVTSGKIASGVVPTLRPNVSPIIINNDMAVSQRGTSFAGHTSGYTIDRYECSESTDGAVTITQDSSVPTGQGFGKSMKWDVTTADSSLSATQFCNIITKLEGQDCQVFNYGTSDAKTLTLSFWCKSSKTGTYCISLVKEAGGQTRYEFVKEYSISSSNTWEKKIITISPTAGSTTFITNSAGAIVNSNASGLRIMFTLCTGTDYQVATNDKWYQTSGTSIATSNQVNFMDNTSNDFYLTGVQLESDSFSSSTIPPFQHESYGESLLRCQRYFRSYGGGDAYEQISVGYNSTTTQGATFIDYSSPVMRAAPSLAVSANGDWKIYSVSTGYECNGSMGASDPTPRNMKILTPHAGSSTAGQGCMLQADGTTSARLTLSAEL